MASLEGGDREAKEKATSSQEEDQSGAEEMTMGGQEPGDIERDEWWHYWLNRDQHIDDPSYSSIKMMGIPYQIDNDATVAVVRYWNAIENEEKYRNAIRKEAVTPVKYWNVWQMSTNGSSWGDEGNAEFKKLYDLGTSIADCIPKKTETSLSQRSGELFRNGEGRMSNFREFAEEMHRMRVENAKKEAASTLRRSTRNARGRATLVRSNTHRS